MVKPDAVARGLTGEILIRIERRGLRVVGLKKTTMTRVLAVLLVPQDAKELSVPEKPAK